MHRCLLPGAYAETYPCGVLTTCFRHERQ